MMGLVASYYKFNQRPEHAFGQVQVLTKHLSPFTDAVSSNIHLSKLDNNKKRSTEYVIEQKRELDWFYSFSYSHGMVGTKEKEN